MVPTILTTISPGRRSLALRHAIRHRRPGLWCDHPASPSSLLLVHDAEGHIEAFGDGLPGPSLARLSRRSEPITLLAPPSWHEPAIAAFGPPRRGRILTLQRPPGRARPPSHPLVVRLDGTHAAGFEALTPPWALRSWGTFANLIDRGAAFGVIDHHRPIAAAWTVESDASFDVIGACVDPRFRRLGLGRAVAGVLVAWILNGERCPIWIAARENEASRRLADALGFSRRVGEEELLVFSGRE